MLERFMELASSSASFYSGSYVTLRFDPNLEQGLIMIVERENGSITDDVVDGNVVLNVTVNGTHTVDADFLDRVLQFVLMELEVDTVWKSGAPVNIQPIDATPIAPAGDDTA